jgi:hypothetical protein
MLAFTSSRQVNDPGTAMTQKDFAMDWNQIENKWAAMTRRVRADWTADRACIKTPSARRAARVDVAPVITPDRQIGTVVDARRKMSAE